MKTKGNPPKDRRITIRLDNDTYQALEKAVKSGEIESVSAGLRQLVRWQTRSHEFKEVTNGEDISELKSGLQKHVPSFLSKLDSEKQEMLIQDGFLHGMFLLLADLVRELIIKELYKRE